MSKVVAVGPFVGDFETEVLSFRPYVRWVFKNSSFDRFYVSSHYSSRFLYEFLDDGQFIQVISEQLSDDNNSKQKYFHKKIDNKGFLRYTRNFRNKIFNKLTDTKKEEIKIIGISYTKLNDPIIASKKVFERIQVSETKRRYILFDKEPIIQDLEYKVVGDCPSHFDLVQLVSNATCVICKAGFLTALANLQGVSVISWCDSYPGIYRSNGIYGFGNNKSKIIYCSDDKSSIIERSIRTFLVEML